MEAFLNKTLVNRKGESFNAQEVLENKQVIILLFSSSACKNIEKLMDILKRVYDVAFEQRCSFEIILIASEKSQANFEQFFREMNGDWYALPYEDSGQVQSSSDELRWRYGITHIPFIVVIKPDGSFISYDGISEIETLGINVVVAWSD